METEKRNLKERGSLWGETTTKCLLIVFIVMNLAFVAMGIVLIGFGSWVLSLEENDSDEITSDISLGAALLVAAGGVTFVVAAVGIIGACGMWRPILIIYIVLVVLLVGLEIAAGIIGFINREEIVNNFVNKTLEVVADSMNLDYGNSSDFNNDVFASIQKTFKCCGVNSSLDWLNVYPEIFAANGNQPPRECICDKEESNCELFNFTYVPEGAFVDQQALYYAWDRGCSLISVEEITYLIIPVEMTEDVNTIAISVGVLGIVVGAIEIFGIVVALILVVDIFLTKKDAVVPDYQQTLKDAVV